MEKSHATGWASGSPTPAQLREQLAQIESGRITKTRMQNFLRGNRDKILLSKMTAAESLAANILDRQQVITAYEVAERWGVEVDPPANIPYSPETLKKCAEENERNENWWLVFVVGLSLRQQYDLRGISIGGRGGGFKYLMPDAIDEYLDRIFRSGYYLFNIRCNFTKMKWQDQEAAIANMGEKFKRADERMLSEVLLSCLMVKYLHFLPVSPLAYHWGFGMMPEDDEGKKKGGIVLFQEGGNNCFLFRDPGHFDIVGSRYGAVVLREPDF